MKLKLIILLSLLFAVTVYAVDADYYIQRANMNLAQVENLSADLRIRSRLPNATIPDRSTQIYFQRPDSLRIEDGKDLLIPREIFLFDIERLVADAKSMRLVEGDEQKNKPVVFVEAIKEMEGRNVIFLTMVDTLKWTMEQMKIIDMPDMVADIKFKNKEIMPGIFLPEDIKVVMETKETAKRNVPNPRGGIPVTSKFGYINISFDNYVINFNTGINDK